MKVYDWNSDEKRTHIDGYSRGVAVGSDLMMAHVKLDDGAITATHSHVYEEIIYVVSGKWRLTLGEKVFELGPDQSLVIPPNVVHSSLAIEETVAVVCTSYRSEWSEDSDYMLHYNQERHLWAV
ncbi:MAG: cupin domain-containing protein [Pyrinomonadaceae bacterium]